MRNAWTHKIQWSGPTVHSSTVIASRYFNVLAKSYKQLKRLQHTEIYILRLRVEYKHKMKLPLDMVRTFMSSVPLAP